MKGVVFKLLEEVVSAEYGEQTWDTLLDTCGLDGVYTSLGSYPDEHVFKLVTAASEALKVSPQEILRWFGRKSMPALAQQYPVFFDTQKSTRPFLISLNSIIHPEVRKVYPGADVPVFDFDVDTSGAMLMGYNSRRKLCALAQGFVEGAAEHFREDITFEHLKCMHHDDPKCLFRISFADRAN